MSALKEIEKAYTQHAKDVYRYLLSLTHDEDLSEELTQETFLGFLIGMFVSLRSLEDFSSAESLGWILLDLPVAMISLFYLLLVWILLLPIGFLLKKHVEKQ